MDDFNRLIQVVELSNKFCETLEAEYHWWSTKELDELVFDFRFKLCEMGFGEEEGNALVEHLREEVVKKMG